MARKKQYDHELEVLTDRIATYIEVHEQFSEKVGKKEFIIEVSDDIDGRYDGFIFEEDKRGNRKLIAETKNRDINALVLRMRKEGMPI